MAAPKRTPIQIAQDRTTIARLYLQGKTQAEIAVELRLSQPQIHYDLKAIQKEWRESRFCDLDQLKADQLAKLDELEREAWSGWRRSQEKKEVTTTERVNGQSQTDRASIRKETQVGDPRFLQIIQSCIEQRLRIFGFYAPTKIDVNVLDGLIEKELERIASEGGDTETTTELVC